ncbi:MAG: WhiB family transcriptional regulator [Dehalococcoidia bacterium]|nr:WhiB family transcriptional regulator [Dehalococcoidia bacterium]
MTGLDWMDAAACKGSATSQWFPSSGKLSARNLDAILLCRTCPVKTHCLQHALEHAEVGIWGGLTDEQRQAMRTRTPRQPSPCGTSGAYRRHNRAGETCDMCRAAESRRRRQHRVTS